MRAFALLLCAALLSAAASAHLRTSEYAYGASDDAPADDAAPAPEVPTVAASTSEAEAIMPNDPRDSDFSTEKVVIPPCKPDAPDCEPQPAAGPTGALEDFAKKNGESILMAQNGNKIKVVRVRDRAESATGAVSPEEAAAEAAAAAEAEEEANEGGMGADGGGVTRGFCAGMLKKIENKEAPYYLEGKFTGETRTVLMTQCSRQICGWAMQYASKVKQCDECPQDCSSPMLFAKQLLASGKFDEMIAQLAGEQPEADAPAAAAPPPAATGPSSNDPRDPAFHDADSLVVGPTGPTELEKLSKVKLEAGEGVVGGAKVEPLVKDGVTKGFCTSMLKSIENKEAPYFVEGKFTGETREDLVKQCSHQVCDWAVSFGKLTANCPECPTDCSQPMSPEDMKTFVLNVLTKLESAGGEPAVTIDA